MLKFLVMSALLLLFAGKAQAQQHNESLKGLVVVVDVGHGSTDTTLAYGCVIKPGALGLYTLTENRASMKASLLLKSFIESRGGRVLPTTTFKDTTEYLLWGCGEHSPEDHNAFFLDGTLVEYNHGAMQKRADVVNEAIHKYGQKRVVFLSLHLNHGSPDERGLFVIGPRFGDPPRIAHDVLTACRAKGLVRKSGKTEYKPYVRNHSEHVSWRRLFLLRSDLIDADQRLILEMDNVTSLERRLWWTEESNIQTVVNCLGNGLEHYNAYRLRGSGRRLAKNK